MPPSRATEAPPFLTARWLDLAMLNYPVDPNLLLPYVPRGTELDSLDGATYVSIVAFHFRDTRVLGLPIPRHRHFEELNLRFYVRRQDDEGVHRGVVFLKEVVPRRAIAWVARALYNEPYVPLPMRHTVSSDQREVSYEWRLAGSWDGLKILTDGEPGVVPSVGSLEEFITEHYRGYTTQRDGSTLEYVVEHPVWCIRRATQARLRANAEALWGPQWGEILTMPAASAFVANGSEIVVRRGRALRSSQKDSR